MPLQRVSASCLLGFFLCPDFFLSLCSLGRECPFLACFRFTNVFLYVSQDVSPLLFLTPCALISLFICIAAGILQNTIIHFLCTVVIILFTLLGFTNAP